MAALEKSQSMIEQAKLSKVPVPWCNEFEKMISGMNFQAQNSQVMSDHKLKIMKQLNSFNDPSVPEHSSLQPLKDRRMGIASQVMGKLGTRVNIEFPFFCVWGCNIFIGNDVYINREVSIYDNAPVTIGNNVLIGPGVCICTGTHDTEPVVRRESGGSFAYPIVIEDDCWIGARATILPGCRIGKGTVIAAGAVVTGDIEAVVVVGGVPAKVIKKLGDGA
ncbi:related to galactoside O-acetyltransferase [Phialocephala subalpina]|uniref:Related to galactoside O-acetyltransferase n=1 Tax=Phialocephala subalpina TaxID=576137 RepID=A0A1L7XRZ1_9HELO|nr:related to galactoside O-acetyltransferase [Phialocephala subalpina]